MRIVTWCLCVLALAGPAHAADVETIPIRNDLGARRTLVVPRTAIQPAEVAVVINDADAQSVEIGAYYVSRHRIPAANVIHVSFPPGASTMSEADFAVLKTRIDSQAGPGIEAYAITWSRPWRIGAGMGMTSALTLGYSSRYVASSVCNMTAPVPYYDSATTRPWTDLGLRPSMMVAGTTPQYVRALVDRGVLAQQSFPDGDGYFVRTRDGARSVRYADFRATVAAWNRPDALRMSYIDNASGSGSDYLQNEAGVLFYLTGLATVPAIETNGYVAGAVADHMTSAAGFLFGGTQMSALRWLEAGATASYGAVVEPCNYPQKFPAASVLVRQYFGGATVLEAYWKSVNQPGEGVFVGDPLARPFGTSAALVNGVLEITTTILRPGRTYSLLAGDSAQGPWRVLQSGIGVEQASYRRVSETSGDFPYYRLVEGSFPVSAPEPGSVAPADIASGGSISAGAGTSTGQDAGTADGAATGSGASDSMGKSAARSDTSRGARAGKASRPRAARETARGSRLLSRSRRR